MASLNNLIISITCRKSTKCLGVNKELHGIHGTLIKFYTNVIVALTVDWIGGGTSATVVSVTI